MSTLSVRNFLETLRESRLLAADQVREISQTVLSRVNDTRSLAKDLLRRGWLTVYQTNLIVEGRPEELVWGDYRILDRLGKGGSAQVFQAVRARDNRLVALKTLTPDLADNAEAVARLRWEGIVLSRLRHRNVVEFLEAGVANGRPYCVTEYLEGMDLAKLSKLSGPLPIHQACEYVRQAALALQAAHQAGFSHCDIKPANLILTTVPGTLVSAPQEVIKLIDWGLAYHATGVDGSLRPPVAQGALLGTADYFAPEQIKNPSAVDIRADIYSLGCTLYCLLAGQPPFPGNSLVQKLMQHQEEQPRLLKSLRPEAPDDLTALVHKMLCKQPEERFQTPLMVAVLLGRYCKPTTAAASR